MTIIIGVLLFLIIVLVIIVFHMEYELGLVKINTECTWSMCLKLISYCVYVNPEVMKKIYEKELNENTEKENEQKISVNTENLEN